MNIRTFITTFTIILATGLLFASCSRYDGSHSDFADKKFEKVISYFTKKLDLNENQQALFANAANSLKELETTFHGSPTIREEIYNEFRNNEINKKNLTIFVEDKVKDFNDRSNAVIDELTKFHDSLTPEQRDTYISIIEKYDKKSRHYRWKIGL